MSVGKRIYLKRRMPDPELVKAFETIPASNVADVMGRNCAHESAHPPGQFSQKADDVRCCLYRKGARRR